MGPEINIAHKFDNYWQPIAWLKHAPKTQTTRANFAMSFQFHFTTFRRLCQFTLDLWTGKGFIFLKKINWQELQSELKRGNNEMLSVFFQEHAGYCTRKLTKEHQCSQEDAEDIFIESVMNLREKLIKGAVEAVANVRSYLYKTCHYMLMDRLRKKGRQAQEEEDVVRFFYESAYTTENDPFDKELVEITKIAWNELSEKCKDILHFFYVDKLEMKEIAELMAFASADVAKTSKSRCFRQFATRAYELKNAHGS